MNNTKTKIYKVLKMLSEKYDGELILGGSFILSELGLIDRPVMDIDVFFHDKRKYDRFTALLTNDPDVETSSDTSFREGNVNVVHTSSFTIDKVNIDVIYVKTECKLMCVDIDGENYICHSVNAILDAKRHMIDNNKHKLDMDHIMSTYNFTRKENFYKGLNNDDDDDDVYNNDLYDDFPF